MSGGNDGNDTNLGEKMQKISSEWMLEILDESIPDDKDPKYETILFVIAHALIGVNQRLDEVVKSLNQIERNK